MVYVFVGREESCSAKRGDAYQSCVRQEDVTELDAEGVAIGLSVFALVVVLRSLRLCVAHGGHRALGIARAMAVGVMAALLGSSASGSGSTGVRVAGNRRGRSRTTRSRQLGVTQRWRLAS
jgi:hypothetical protein